METENPFFFDEIIDVMVETKNKNSPPTESQRVDADTTIISITVLTYSL
jgi:hypothetical protein